MIYRDFKGKKISMLSFGTMRLPTLENGQIDEEQVLEMTRLALSRGVNYFDTAYPYHNGQSELVMGRVLKNFDRDSFYLADKYPGHQISESYNPAEIFEEQLKKCGVDYFDFYLLHNVYENSMDIYLDEKWGVLEYFREQKRLGRIKHLGFSTHARLKTLERFLEIAHEDMEFCQIQLNYMDWSLQDAKGKVELLNQYNIPIFVMEPLRGGKLCSLSYENEQKLKSVYPDKSVTSWGFRYLEDIEGVTTILSGMSNIEQMCENIETFESEEPLTENDKELLYEIAESMKNSVPCTACRYCTKDCPMALDIPTLIETYNDLEFFATTNSAMIIEFMPENKKPSACIACGKCKKMCPQMIDIPSVLQKLDEKLETIPKWREICRVREEAAKKIREQNK